MFNATSQFLKGFKTAANGPIVEIFIMDNKGLNVAQTDPTSDYGKRSRRSCLLTCAT